MKELSFNIDLNCLAKENGKEENTGQPFLKISGIATKLGEENLNGYTVEKGAFDEFMAKNKDNNFVMLFNHSSDKPIGKASFYLDKNEDLMFEGKVYTNTSIGGDVANNIKNEVLKGVSIGFKVLEEVENREDGNYEYKVTKAEIYELSVVTFAGSKGSEITSYLSEAKKLGDFEKALKGKGFTQKEAKLYIANFKKFLSTEANSVEKQEEKEINEKLITESLNTGLSNLKNSTGLSKEEICQSKTK